MKTKTISRVMMLLLLCCSSWSLSAQFEITGRVVFGESQEPVPDYSVSIFLPVHEQYYTFQTNEDGRYQAGFDWTSAEKLEAIVSVSDPCTGVVQEVVLPDSSGAYVANFHLCQGVNPPPPTDSCVAFFTYEQLEVNPPTVLFIDLSYSSDPEVQYSWDFGDGTTITEPAFTHQYQELGVYEVSLNISSESCAASYTQTLVLTDSLDCVCAAVYNPVCVTLDNGVTLTFPNDCEARCAGFQKGDWMSCEPNECSCPEFYDPVCAISSAGDTLTFSNVCFAECAGYGPDLIYNCNPINECECAPIDAPVCVVNDAGEILNFPSACLAACAGYPASAIVDCEGGCVCPEYYDPVCVVIDMGADTLTFSNSCFAQCEGYGADEIFACNPYPTCDCPDENDPICTIGPDGVTRTFLNRCYAYCEGYEDAQLFPCDSTCFCPDYYDPVCVMLPDSLQLTFGNICIAQCAGYSEEEIFKCEPVDCICPDTAEYAPVCVVEHGVTISFSNKCLAICAGFSEDAIFECEPEECNCPEIYSPVCIVTDFGEEYWFVNACQAECAGFGPDQYESCGPQDCVCPTIYDPVCVVGMEGDSLLFGNACEAICAGFPEDELVKCGFDNPCGCDAVYDPVCVFTPGGTVLRFANECEARCEGYQEDHWVKCDETYCQAQFWVEYSTDSTDLTIQFINRSEPMEDSTVQWIWDLGDGNISEGLQPYHTYAHEGIYEVALTMITASGCTSTYREQIVVGSGGYEPNCKALFFFEQDALNPYFFQFHDRSLGNAVSWLWYFGDGTTSSEPTPQHTYAQAGIYIVSLAITAADGCTDLVSMLVAADDNIVYNSDCHALFLPILVPGVDTVAFLNFSTANAVETHWDFGDGTTSSDLMPIHVYETSGTFTVTLTVVTQSGCTNSYAATINIDAANFTATPQYAFRTTTDTDDPFANSIKVKLFPNPVQSDLWLDLQDFSGGELQWRIISMNGQVVQQNQQELGAGQQRFSIATFDLPAGVYALQLMTKEGMITKKFVKDDRQ